MKTRKRDGRLDLFDPSKIALAIEKAAQSAGMNERLLAEELASLVTLFLEKDFSGAVVPSLEIQETVERVLMETGHTEIAKAFLLYRERREKIKEVIQIREPLSHASTAGDDLEVDGGRSGTIAPWSKARIIDALLTEAEIPAGMAHEIASEVESRVFRSGLTRISSSLVRELVDNELFNRGLNGRLLHQSLLGIPAYDLRNLVESDGDGCSPSEVSGIVSESILKQYALRWIHTPEEAESHLRKDARILGLSAPSGYLAIELEPLLLPAPYGGPSASASHLAPCIRFLEQFVARSVEVKITDTVIHAYCSCGVTPESYAEDLLLSLAQGPASCLSITPSPTILLSRRLTDRRMEILKAANMQRAAARRFIDTAITAFLDTAIRLGRELALPRLHLDLTGDPVPDERLLARAILLEAADRLETGLPEPVERAVGIRQNTGSQPAASTAAITPLMGSVSLSMEGTFEHHDESVSLSCFDELRSSMAMAASAMFSKNQYMKKLNRRGRGPMAAIRRHLGGKGETVGPGYFEVIPTVLLNLMQRAENRSLNEHRAEPGSKSNQVNAVAFEMAGHLSELVQEESAKMDPEIRLVSPWSLREKTVLPRFDAVSPAVGWTQSWQTWFPIDPMPPCFIGDADQRMAFLSKVLSMQAENKTKSESDRS